MTAAETSSSRIKCSDAVKEILAAGGYTTVNTLGNGFGQINGIAIDGNGNVFVADAGDNVVREIVAAGGYTTVNTLGSGFDSPWALRWTEVATFSSLTTAVPWRSWISRMRLV